MKKFQEFNESKKFVVPRKDKKTGMYKYPKEMLNPRNMNVTIPLEYWPKMKMIVNSEETKEQILAAIEHIHYSDADGDFIAVNCLRHMYLHPGFVEVDPDYDFDCGPERN